jgi:hypothetical protein
VATFNRRHSAQIKGDCRLKSRKNGRRFAAQELSGHCLWGEHPIDRCQLSLVGIRQNITQPPLRGWEPG